MKPERQSDIVTGMVYPAAGPGDFDELLRPLPAETRAVAAELRRIVRATLPTADEAVSGGAKIAMALYSVGGPSNVVCGIQPTAGLCKLFFHNWQAIKDAGYRLEGSGTNARHVKVRSLAELAHQRIADMLRIASASSH